MTPRKYIALVDCARQLNNPKGGNKAKQKAPIGFIDTIPGW